jgi:succinate dehydrogenase flavin-adding protein (antitoxin of CptAB toxin-antitoxin module)
MRELDSLLLNFFDRFAGRMTSEEIATFERVLELPDPTLHSYLLGRSAPDDAATGKIIERIRASVGSES